MQSAIAVGQRWLTLRKEEKRRLAPRFGSRGRRDRKQRSLRDVAGMDPFSESETGAYCANDCSLSCEPHTLAQAIDAFNPGTVCSYEISNSKVLHLVGRPIHLFVCSSKQVQSS